MEACAYCGDECPDVGDDGLCCYCHAEAEAEEGLCEPHAEPLDEHECP